MNDAESFYPEYTVGELTLKIKGTTSPQGAAQFAVARLREGEWYVDFVFMGGNAGQQADKACYAAHRSLVIEWGIDAFFIPLRFVAQTRPERDPQTGEVTRPLKDIFVWRLWRSEAYYDVAAEERRAPTAAKHTGT